ncbi:MAG: outer membrane beta-barrel protein [Aestuariivirga sp.]|nr:outer membrane beta-barrel protein [Aestuariivirga sp.]
MKLFLAALVFLIFSMSSNAARADEVISVSDPAFDWSGFHIGIYGAYGYGDTQSNDDANSNPKDPYPGIIGGYAVAFDGFTLGVAGDLSLADLDGDTGSGAGFVSQDIDNIAAVRGQVGIPFHNFQLFVSAGWAWADSERATPTDRDSKMLHGPTFGIGMQRAISEHLGARLQLDYYSYGKVEYDMPGSPEVNSSIATFKLGIDYYH